MNPILPSGHPSIGAKCAVFMFAIGQAKNILSVEAPNEWAVLCLERLLLVDGKVSDVCEVLQVIRNPSGVGTRSEKVEEVPFPDFMTDIVDPSRVTSDSIVLTAFGNALSDEERQTVQRKLEMVQNEVEDVFEGFSDPDSQIVEPLPAAQVSDQAEQLTTALVNLGFKKNEVRRVVAAFGDRTRTDNMHSLIREGLSQLAA